MRLWHAVFIVLGILSIGALGFKTADKCTGNGFDQAVCLHEAAMSYAVFRDEGNALAACERIKYVADSSGSVITNAEGQANVCYESIAEILGNENICNSIADSNAMVGITGAEARKEICITKISERRQRTANYRCALLPFTLALITAGFICSRKSP